MPSIRQATLTIGQIRLSPWNVRTNEEDATSTTGLEASILEEGLLHAINVHPMRGNTKQWGAFAGGRRYRSISNLVGRGDLPDDWPVKVSIYEGYSDAQLIVLSIAENVMRKNLRDYELYAGVVRAIALGETIEDIARELGQPELHVKRWMCIGQLAKPIFKAFADGELTIGQAQAFAARDDHELQLAAFNAIMALADPRERTPDRIRRAMKVGDAEARRLLAFVGEDAYREAGGRYALDLFADEAEERGSIVDEGTLRQLADAKLDSLRAEIRADQGRADLRFQPRPPQNDYGDDQRLQIMSLPLPNGDVVATIDIGADGMPMVRYWWASTSAKYGAGEKKAANVSAGPIAAPSAPTPEPGSADPKRSELGLSADGTKIFKAIRRMILRGLLVHNALADGDVATDFLVYSQIRLMLGLDMRMAMGIAQIPHPENGFGFSTADKAREFVNSIPASLLVGKAMHALKTAPFMEGSAAEGFALYRAANPSMKRIAAAYVVGVASGYAINADGHRLPILDALAAELGGDDEQLSELWSPTAEQIDLFDKPRRMEMAAELVAPVTLRAWAKLKGDQLTEAVLRAVSGKSWVHPLLRFGPPPPAPAPVDAAELAEAAE
ncbi:MAG TPA: ParB N-terminal domain-containing protein [Sphingomonas sp.]